MIADEPPVRADLAKHCADCDRRGALRDRNRRFARSRHRSQSHDVNRDLLAFARSRRRSRSRIGAREAPCRRTQSSVNRWWFFFWVFFGFCLCFSGFVFSFFFSKHQKIFFGLFLLLFLTPKNIFRIIFWNATKHMKTFSFPENSIFEKWNIFRKCFYTNQTQP